VVMPLRLLKAPWLKENRLDRGGCASTIE